MDEARGEKGRGGVHVALVNWDGCGCGEGAQGMGLDRSSSNQRARQYFGAAPIQVDDVWCQH